MTIRVGLLGAGGINRIVATAAREGRLPGIHITAVAGSGPDSQSARETAALVDARVVEAAALADYSDWVLEAAGRQATIQYAPLLWSKGVNTVLMSIGALLDPEVEEAAARYRHSGGRIVLPSGAVAGLDGIRAMAADGGLESVKLTMIKSPVSLAGAPYLSERGIELSNDAVVDVFEGSAREAAAGFPANVNVSVALSFAGLGPDRTVVAIKSDPAASITVHRIEAVGDSAELRLELRLKHSPLNPRTSYLAALSAIAALREVVGV